MSKVSDMVKMYSHSAPNNTGPRKWQTGVGGGARPPPTTPKPSNINQNGTGHRPGTATKPFSANHTTRSDDNIPQWKKDLDKRRANQATHEEKPSQENIPEWKLRMMQQKDKTENKVDAVENQNVPAWKKRMTEQKETAEDDEEDKSIPAWKRELNKAKAEKTSNNTISPFMKNNEAAPKPTSSLWSAPKQDPTRTGLPPFNIPKNPPPTLNSNTKPTHTSSLWSDRNKNAQNFTGGVNNANSFNDTSDQSDDRLAPKRSTQQNKSFSYNTAPKMTIEKTSGSFGSVSQIPEKKPAEVPGQPKQRVSSFLHTKKSPTPGRKYSESSQPILPSPPPPADKPKLTNGVPRKLPIPKEKLLVMPPIKTPKPPHVVLPKGRISSLHPHTPSSTSRPLPQQGSRDRSSALPPPPGSCDMLPPPPNLPPSLPARPKDFAAPELPARPLPSPTPPTSKKMMPLPIPPSDNDDIYDDPGEEPPPLPTTPRGFPVPLEKKESFGMIPTWDDEADAIYDETPEEPPPPARSAFPPGFPGGGAPQIPEDDGEDMYEDFEETQRSRKMQQKPPTPPPQRNTNGSVTSSDGKDKKDKKKKDSEKKEKEIRKKFKIEGEIVPEGHGVVKETCRGWGKGLAVTAGENIDVIRMTDNPKGKWLIRNEQGEFGYVDSDKVTITLDQLRNTFGVGGRPPPPPMIGGGPPPLIPTMDDEDIYDAPPDEDVYEEL